MEGKDKRSKDKRHKMKSHYRNKSKYCTTSSSSGRMVRVNLADSSDDENVWIGSRKVDGKEEYPIGMPDFPDENDENEQMRAGDFNFMSQLTSATGGHFKFSSEKQWEQAETDDFIDNTEASEYFTLNIKLLNVGLKTIPFYKRMDYPSSMFDKEQLVIMEKEAEETENMYQKILKEHIENPKIKINSASRKANSARSQITEKAKTPEAQDELDELLNMTTDQMSTVSVKSESNTPALNPIPSNNVSGAGSATGADDIQQWLDNVLEE